MGLLDQLTHDPQMALGMGLLNAGGNSRMPVSLGQGLAQGWGNMQQTAQMAQRAKMLEQEQMMREMQMQQMQKQQQEQDAMQQAARESYQSPAQQALMGGGGPTIENAAKLPGLSPQFNTEMFLSKLSQSNPLKAMELARKEEKPLIPVGADQTLFDPNKGKAVFTGAPKKSELDVLLDAAGIADPAQRAKFASNALLKKTTHAPAASATVKLPPMQTKFEEAVGKQQGEDYANIQKAGFSASATLNNLDRMSALLQGVETGKLAPLTKDIASIAASIGINIDPQLGQKEAIASIANEMALKAKNQGGENLMPGAMSDPDRRFLVEMVPGLANTPGGNAIIIETLRRKAKRDIEVAKMARAYAAKNGNFNGFSDELAAWSEKNPLFADLSSKVGGSAPPGAVRRIK